MKNLFSIRWIFIVLIFIIVLYIGFGPKSHKKWIMSNFFNISQMVLEPVTGMIQTVQNKISHEIEYFYRQRYLNEQMLKIERENRLFRRRITELSQLELENERLRRLLGLKEKEGFQSIAGEIIAVAPSNYYQTLILDKGERDGLARNMVVIKEEGLVGRILETGLSVSKILLIADERSAVAVVVEGSGSRAILEGMGGGKCRLVLEDPQIVIQEGDKIFTSGLGGIFPKGILVGQVEKIERDKNTGWINFIEVRPAVNHYDIQEVLVIIEPIMALVMPDIGGYNNIEP